MTKRRTYQQGLKPEVSICCITYNHAPYIKAALDSFLAQHTDFEFEILIHDDASTDGTTEILKEYEERHDSVRVYYEDENQHGKGRYRGGYVNGCLVPHAKGKYIALCEGDDYWTDCNKLQCQHDYLEAHPDCYETTHCAAVVDGVKGDLLGVMGMGDDAQDLSGGQIIANWNIPTASRMFRKSYVSEYVEVWDFDKPVGDFPSVLFSATKGYVHYDPRQMSVYRYRVPGSWTSRMRNPKDSRMHAERWIGMLESIDGVTGGCWHSELVKAAKPYARIMAAMDGADSIGEGYFAREILGSFNCKDNLKCCIKRVLWLAGLTVDVDGYGKSARKRLVRRVD